MCWKYYLGHDIVDNSLSTQDVCHQVSDLKQEWRYRNGRIVREIPDDLFNKFLLLPSSLPESAHQWTIQLCSAYYTALTEDLANIMARKTIVMPSLTALDTKDKKLAAIKVVRETASEQYKVLEEEE